MARSAVLNPPKNIVFRRLIPKTDDELWWLVKALWGVEIPRVAVCDHHDAPFDAFADAFFGRSSVAVWKGSRGLGGKSFMLAILSLTEMVCFGAQISVLGGSAAQSQRVHEISQEAWFAPNAPRIMLASDPTLYKTSLVNGGWLVALTASQRSARGLHPQRLRLDEIDEMDIKVLRSAQGQPMDKFGIKSQTVMSSTHQYADGTMSEILKEAVIKGWPVFEWCVADVGISVYNDGKLGTKMLSQLEPGVDHVLTRQGPKAIQHVTYVGTKPVLRIRDSAGREIVCTADHRIATPDGWVRAGSLEPTSRIIGLTTSVFDAGLATALTITGVDLSVGNGVLMPLGAVGLEVPPVVLPVGTSGQDLKVLGVDTITPSASVVDFKASGDVTDEHPVGQARANLLMPDVGTTGDLGVAVITVGTTPFPAPVIEQPGPVDDVVLVHQDLGSHAVEAIGTALASPSLAPATDWFVAFDTFHVASIDEVGTERVYDIGVHDAHEFIANGIVVHNCFKESLGTPEAPGWLSAGMVERKKSEVTEKMWETEYEMQEPSIEGRAVDTDKVEICYSKTWMPSDGAQWVNGEFDGLANEALYFEKPVRGARYVTGVDWAKEKDWTVIRTFRTDCRPWREVAFLRENRKPWPVMIADLQRRLDQYGGMLVHDATGIGNVIDDMLEWPPNETVGYVMRGRQRELLLNDYIAALENEEMHSPHIRFAYDECRFVTLEDLYTPSGHAPDSFVAGAMAWAGRDTGGIPVAAVNVSQISKWKGAGY